MTDRDAQVRRLAEAICRLAHGFLDHPCSSCLRWAGENHNARMPEPIERRKGERRKVDVTTTACRTCGGRTVCNCPPLIAVEWSKRGTTDPYRKPTETSLDTTPETPPPAASAATSASESTALPEIVVTEETARLGHDTYCGCSPQTLVDGSWVVPKTRAEYRTVLPLLLAANGAYLAAWLRTPAGKAVADLVVRERVEQHDDWFDKMAVLRYLGVKS